MPCGIYLDSARAIHPAACLFRHARQDGVLYITSLYHVRVARSGPAVEKLFDDALLVRQFLTTRSVPGLEPSPLAEEEPQGVNDIAATALADPLVHDYTLATIAKNRIPEQLEWPMLVRNAVTIEPCSADDVSSKGLEMVRRLDLGSHVYPVYKNALAHLGVSLPPNTTKQVANRWGKQGIWQRRGRRR